MSTQPMPYPPYPTYPPPIYGTGYNPGGVNSGQYASPTGPSGIPTLNTDPNQDIHNMFYNDQGIINAQGEQLNQEALNQLNYYGPLQQYYQGQGEQALQQLQQTPGFTPGEAGQINVDYSQFNTSPGALQSQFLTPDEQTQIAGDPFAAQNMMYGGTQAQQDALSGYRSGVNDQLTGMAQNLTGELGTYDTSVGGAYSQYGTGLKTATDTLGSGLSAAQGKFGSLDAAVNNPALGFDPNATEKQLTDADVQQMKTAAGTRIGNQYQAAEDTLERNAANAGNTSPLALAAARARLQTQEAADQGDAETNADIAARQAQYQRAAGIEGQREGAVQTQTGFKAGAATTEEQAAQTAAALAGTTDVAAATQYGQSGVNTAQDIGKTGLNAMTAYDQARLNALAREGEFSTTTAGNIAQANYGAANTAEQAAAQRAAALAGNRQATQTGVNQTQYGQGVGSQQLTSGGAQTVGNARMQGLANYRAGLTQQQGMAQQGGQAAMQSQQAAYGTRTGGLNQSTSGRAGYESAGYGNSAINQATKMVGAVLDEGAIVDKPTIAVIGEKRPEMVIPLPPRYGSGRRKAA